MKKILVSLLFLVSIEGFSQASLHRRAGKCYVKYQYATAANLYEKILKKSPSDPVAKTRLAQCYKFLRNRNDWRGQPGGKQNSSGANVPVK